MTWTCLAPAPSPTTESPLTCKLHVVPCLRQRREGTETDRLFQEDQASGVEGQASPQALSLHSAYPESGSQRGMELGWGQGGSTLGS